MLTTLTITSLDQGKELARRQVEKLYAEPVEPTPRIIVEEAALAEVTAGRLQPPRRGRHSLVARFLSFWDAALPIGVWRL